MKTTYNNFHLVEKYWYNGYEVIPTYSLLAGNIEFMEISLISTKIGYTINKSYPNFINPNLELEEFLTWLDTQFENK